MSGHVPEAAAAAAPSLDELAEWAAGQWEELQLYLLGSAKAPPAMPQLLRVGGEEGVEEGGEPGNAFSAQR